MVAQNWLGNELDKDIIVVGNKVYSPDTCAFISQATNIFTIDSSAARGKWPIGVSFNSRDGKFQAQCGNPITKKRESIGYFSCPDKAHLAWKKRKHELACQLADMQSDIRVAEALRLRYSS